MISYYTIKKHRAGRGLEIKGLFFSNHLHLYLFFFLIIGAQIVGTRNNVFDLNKTIIEKTFFTINGTYALITGSIHSQKTKDNDVNNELNKLNSIINKQSIIISNLESIVNIKSTNLSNINSFKEVILRIEFYNLEGKKFAIARQIQDPVLIPINSIAIDEYGLVGRVVDRINDNGSLLKIQLANDANFRIPVNTKISKTRGIATGTGSSAGMIINYRDQDCVNEEIVVTSGDASMVLQDIEIGKIANGDNCQLSFPRNPTKADYIKILIKN